MNPLNLRILLYPNCYIILKMMFCCNKVTFAQHTNGMQLGHQKLSFAIIKMFQRLIKLKMQSVLLTDSIRVILLLSLV